jgi:hypothetical protein
MAHLRVCAVTLSCWTMCLRVGRLHVQPSSFSTITTRGSCGEWYVPSSFLVFEGEKGLRLLRWRAW